MLKQDSASKSNVLHQLCNQAAGFEDAVANQKVVEKSLDALSVFVRTLVEEVGDDPTLAKKLLAKNKFGNTPMHLLFAQLPIVAPKIKCAATAKATDAARDLVKLAKIAYKCPSDPQSWATAFAVRNEFNHTPMQILELASAKFPPSSKTKGQFKILQEMIFNLPADCATSNEPFMLPQDHKKKKKPSASKRRRTAGSGLEVVIVDIAEGQERLPIPCLRDRHANEDSSHVLGGGNNSFTYRTALVMGADVGAEFLSSPADEDENASGMCGCFAPGSGGSHELYVHGGQRDLPYNVDGKLTQAFMKRHTNHDGAGVSFIAECNSACQCGPQCPMRVVTRSLKPMEEHGSSSVSRLTGPNPQIVHELFVKSKDTGDALYTKNPIKEGEFVMAYSGTIKRADGQLIENNTYVLELPLDWEATESLDNKTRLVVDGLDSGNIGRFANHSCTPNLTNVMVYSDDWAIRFDPKLVDLADFNHQEIHRVPLPCFFARCDIPAGTELTWNYGYSPGSLPGRVVFCMCQTPPSRCCVVLA